MVRIRQIEPIKQDRTMKTFEFFLRSGDKIIGRGHGIFTAFQAAIRDNVMYGDGNVYDINRDVKSYIQVR